MKPVFLEFHAEYSSRNPATCTENISSHTSEKSSLYEKLFADKTRSNYGYAFLRLTTLKSQVYPTE